MKAKRWLLASLAVLVVLGVVGFVVHHVLLADMYKDTASIWRPAAEMGRLMGVFWIGNIIYALMFTFIYTKGYEKKKKNSTKSNVEQGLRYGVYISLLTCVPMSFGWYALLPIPGMLAVYWAIAGVVESAAAGVAVGLVYKA